MKFKKGDIITCVNNHSRINVLTLGKSYKTLREGDELVEVVNDRGKKVLYFSTRFKINESERVLKILSYYD